jgi:hypothetical protein
VDRFVRANGAGEPSCRIAPADAAELPPSIFDKHVEACATSCAQAGREALALKKERSKPVMCCDGTRSPSCTYENLHQGCCSGHRGVCIE